MRYSVAGAAKPPVNFFCNLSAANVHACGDSRQDALHEKRYMVKNIVAPSWLKEARCRLGAAPPVNAPYVRSSKTRNTSVAAKLTPVTRKRKEETRRRPAAGLKAFRHFSVASGSFSLRGQIAGSSKRRRFPGRVGQLCSWQVGSCWVNTARRASFLGDCKTCAPCWVRFHRLLYVHRLRQKFYFSIVFHPIDWVSGKYLFIYKKTKRVNKRGGRGAEKFVQKNLPSFTHSQTLMFAAKLPGVP